MGLSRTVTAILFGWLLAPSAAFAETSWQMVPAPADPLGDVQRAAMLTGVSADPQAGRIGCLQEGEEEILVCGRRGPDFRVESEPEPGARRRLIAGEPPSAMGAMSAGGCIGDCRRSVGITVDPIRLFRDPIGALRDALGIRR